MDCQALREGEIHVWQASLDGDADSLRRLSALLSSEERDRTARFHFQQDRDRWARCRGVLRMLLGRYLSGDASKIHLLVDEKGKPYLNGELTFNLSHSSEAAVFAFALHRRIGIDVERLRPVPDAKNMVESYFSASEKREFRDAAIEKRDETFLTIWTRKEAYLKALGEGLAHPLDQDPPPGWTIDRKSVV